MKRLGVYVFMVATLAGIVFANPSQVYAQGIDRVIEKQDTSTLAQLQTKGEGLFSAQLSLLQIKKIDPSATGTVPAPPTVVDALIKAVTESSAVFTSTFSSGNDLASVRYKKALLAAATYISTEQAKNGQVLRQPYANNVIGALTRQLNDEALASEKAAALIQGGYTPEQVKTLAADMNASRATAVAGATEAKKEPVGKCSLFAPSNVPACIDEGFAWLIKNTLLQIAGFLVWLTANMLNYAIQVSILGFSDWAPDALYPIWVVIRQIVSLFVVFAGLWLGFMYIIGDETKFGKYVGWLVIFALFVNFSYPFSRALVDISNIVSLNVYSAAVGPEVLAGSTNNTAGSMIMARLGLQELVASATDVSSSQGADKKGGFVNQITTTPGALITLAFVLYAAYVFFMATAIIVTRMAVLVFLIVASPLLLVDSVIPKLGDAAVKMRKMFFEQLVVAPVFMIMLALTLKFMDVFQAPGASGKPGPLGTATAGALTGGADSIKVFFSVLMMLIMLHIMIKVTKSLAGQAGEYATGFMGKVGGFGLGVAAGGAGILARGSIGAAAARMRDSDWMKNAQDSKIGRGMHGLTNSLAQSTFDTRNIGMVKTGMAKAGLTGIGGIGMGAGTKNGYDDDFKARETKIRAKSSYITDANVRDRYLGQMTNTVGARAQSGALKVFGLKGKEGRNDAEIIRDNIMKNKKNILDKYNALQDEDRKLEFLESQPQDIKDFINSQKQNKQSPIFKDRVPADSAPVKIETTNRNMDTAELDQAGFVPKEDKVPTEQASNVAESPTYTPKGTVVPNGALTFNFNGVAHQSFTSAVRQSAGKTPASTPTQTPTSNQQVSEEPVTA